VGVTRRLPRDLFVTGVIVAWVALGAGLDHDAGLMRQRAIGVATWALLVALLAGESRLVRVQVVLVVLAATCVEYTASVGLGLYSYRLGNVPSFVPPGHGLIYLCAIVMGRSRAFAEWRRWLVPATLTVAGAWAIGGLLSSRHDVLGAVLFLFLVRFCLFGRAPLVYCGAFLITSYLEIVGTNLGCWTWATHDPTGLIPMGNPPSVISGGYCFLDLFGLAMAPVVIAAASGLLDRRHRQPEPDEALVVHLGPLAVARPDDSAAAAVDPVGVAEPLLVPDVG
jgi:hypothetical protein